MLKKFGLAIVVALLVLAGLSYWFRSGRPPAPLSQGNKAFFVDEESGDESVGDINAIPPLAGKSGKLTVVRVVKYTCDGGKTKKALFYAKYPEEVQAELNSLK